MPKITPVDLQARKREGRKITMLSVYETYRDEVLAEKFPAEEHTYHIDPKELAKLEAAPKRG